MSKKKLSAMSDAPQVTRIIIMHGDKGGVGKSFVAMAVADFLSNHGEKVAIIDTDSQNPDVHRMFKVSLPSMETNVRTETGWMDVIDFVMQNQGHTIIMNTPAGIGEYMQNDMRSFSEFLKDQDVPIEMELWWTMNAQHDSVNLLSEAHKAYGQYFERIRVICNTHFSDGKETAFFLWGECPFRTKLEKTNGMTIYFPGLHLRAVEKLFNPDKIMPFSDAVDVVLGESLELTNSERWKLQDWLKQIKVRLAPVFGIPAPGSLPAPASESATTATASTIAQ